MTKSPIPRFAPLLLIALLSALPAAAQPRVRYWLRGRPREARAFVIAPGKRFRVPTSLPAPLQRVARFLAPYRKAGWAFAVLSPAAR